MQNTAFSALIFICYLFIWNQCLSHQICPHTHIARLLVSWVLIKGTLMIQWLVWIQAEYEHEADKNIVANITIFLKLQVEMASQ